MRIRQLHVDGFGIWTDLELAGLAQPLVVFYGENEAGKTTLMQFVRSMLYGFSPERRGRYLPPVHGGKPGGSLWAQDGQQTYLVRRHAARHAPEDHLEITDEQGVRREGRPLAQLLDGVDEAIFNNVFAFGLGEIQELATLTDSAAADLLYELTLGLDRVSLSDVVHELDASRRHLLAEHDGSGQIAELVERRDCLRGELRDLARATPRFLELVRSRQELDRAAGDLEAEEEAIDRRLQQLSLAQQIEPRWRSRQDIDRQLDALGTIPHIADDCLPQLEDLKTRSAAGRNRLQRVTDRRKELLGDVARLKINDALCRQAPRLEALAEQQQWIASLEAQARQLEAELAEMTAAAGGSHMHGGGHARSSDRGSHAQPPAQPERHARHDRHSGHPRPAHHERTSGPQHAAGTSPGSVEQRSPQHLHGSERNAGGQHRSAADVPAPTAPLSPQTIAALRSQGRALRQLRQRMGKAKGEKTAARQSANEIKQKISTGRGEGEEPVASSLERAGTLVSQLRRRVQIDERLDQLERRQHELEDKSHVSLDQQVPPAAQILSHGMFFAGGIALVLVSIFMSSMLPHGFGVGIGFLGLILAGVGWLLTYASHNQAGQQFDDCQTRLDQLKEQLATTEKERDELDKQLPKGGGPLVARLQTAEKELARLEELVPLDTHHQHGVRTYKAARVEHRGALREYKKARQKWRSALIHAGLPGDLTPRELRASIERGQQLQALGRKVEERQAQLVDCRRQHEILADRIMQVAVDARLDLDESDPLALLREMLRRLQDEQLRVHSRDQLKASLVRLRRVRRKLARKISTVKQRLDELIGSHGARDEEDLRRRLGIQDEARRLDRARQAVDDEIAAALAGHDEHTEIAALLGGATGGSATGGSATGSGATGGGHDLRTLADDANAEKHALRARLGHVWEERGALLEQIKSHSVDRGLAEKRLELAHVKRSLRQAIGRWQVLGTCSAALDRVREVYERQRQPEVLREASELFARLTGGRYTRAWSSLGHRVLWVDDAQGKPLSVDKLSRGTREQLFLCLRLALVSAYARRGVRLPIVMDDVLVNFDVGRVRAAVEVLRDFVRAGHQILVFTCHEHIASLFRKAQVEVRPLPGNLLSVEDLVEPEPEPRVIPAPHFLPLPVAEPPTEEELTLAEIDDEPEVLLAPIEPLPREMPPAIPLPSATVLAEPEPVQVVREAPRQVRRPRKPRPVVEPVTATPQRRVRREQWVDSVPWSAEEFAGELADRVRRSQPIIEYLEEPVRPAMPLGHDEETLDVQFEDDTPYHGRNGHRGR